MFYLFYFVVLGQVQTFKKGTHHLKKLKNNKKCQKANKQKNQQTKLKMKTSLSLTCYCICSTSTNILKPNLRK